MSNDELLEKYLDGTLEPNQQLEFETLMATTPELARDMRELLWIETMLSEQNPVLPDDSPQFLQRVEDTMAAIIRDEKGQRAPAPLQGTTTNGITRWALLVAGIILVGATLLLVVRPFDDDAPVSVQRVDPSTPVAIAPAQPDVVPDNQSPTPAIEDEEKEEKPEMKSLVPAVETPTTADSSHQPREADHKLDASITNSTVTNTDLERLEQEHRNSQAGSDKASQGMTAKKLGVYLREHGDLVRSRTYLEEALQIARATGLIDLEAQSLGELGLLEARLGNKDRAVKNIQECLALLRSSGGAGIPRWERQLELSGH